MRAMNLELKPDARPTAIDLPLADSAALRRLVLEVEQERAGGFADLTLYNRTYHRHNR
jgi:hypothetical protein